jgi:hypothetical protein
VDNSSISTQTQISKLEQREPLSVKIFFCSGLARRPGFSALSCNRALMIVVWPVALVMELTELQTGRVEKRRTPKPIFLAMLNSRVENSSFRESGKYPNDLQARKI